MAARSFPEFSDGNVEIHFSSAGENYVLALHSSWFKASLSERWSGGDENTMVNGKNHWVYELRFGKESSEGTLVHKQSAEQPTDTELCVGRDAVPPPRLPVEQLLIDVERHYLVTTLQDMLCTLYHLPPTFSPGRPGSFGVRPEVVALCDTAQYYGCDLVVRPYIENHLAQDQTQFSEDCHKNPLIMLEFAIAVRSGWIFMEAATHIIGWDEEQYEEASEELEKLSVDGLLDRKRAEFKTLLESHEYRLLRLGPCKKKPHRSHHSYMAVSCFRDWLNRRINIGDGSHLGPSYASLYREIGTTPMEDFKPSLEHHMRKANADVLDVTLKDMRPDMELILKRAQDIVRPLLKNEARWQDEYDKPFRPLTCMTIDEKELPWVQK
ncbi:hypothetical protein LTR37_002605 [Vermiconidia calcicola]|uniref:Uncharacterized protein n=1 Tax=Vermiconidia calcicola TaxID=1690605 RepID=A0ACC3NTV5_9PEZI|nr:hypothetical protein LTR37_002605 [Vermiconidia calcicola]